MEYGIDNMGNVVQVGGEAEVKNTGLISMQMEALQVAFESASQSSVSAVRDGANKIMQHIQDSGMDWEDALYTMVEKPQAVLEMQKLLTEYSSTNDVMIHNALEMISTYIEAESFSSDEEYETQASFEHKNSFQDKPDFTIKRNSVDGENYVVFEDGSYQKYDEYQESLLTNSQPIWESESDGTLRDIPANGEESLSLQIGD